MVTEEEVAVWYQWTEGIGAVDRSIDAVLSDGERARRDRFVFERDRRDFAAAHTLLRHVLSKYGDAAPADWRFEIESGGKPVLVDDQAGSPRLHFNLSHTNGLVACAVSRGCPVGIDVERCTRVVGAPQIAARYFTPQEQRLLDAC